MLITTATDLPHLMECIGSRLMPPSFPNVDADRTLRDEGNAAHWAAYMLFNNKLTFDFLDNNPTKAPNGVYITSDMIGHIKSYLSVLECGEMEIETSFGTDAFRINARADHVCWNPITATLFVDDFKYGWSPVNPENNWTLIAHAIGSCIFRQIQPKQIHLTIHQPHPYHPDGKTRTWIIDYPTLMEKYSEIIERLSNPTDLLTTNPHCRRCHALATCPAAREASYNAIDASSLAFDDNLTNTEISCELKLLEQACTTIENRLEALRNLGSHKVKDGEVIEGYGLDKRYGNRKWKPEITPDMLKALTGQNLVKPGLVSPAEAERKNVHPSILEHFTDRPLIGTKFVRVDTQKRAERLLK